MENDKIEQIGGGKAPSNEGEAGGSSDYNKDGEKVNQVCKP
jgi:hypothetical protein